MSVRNATFWNFLLFRLSLLIFRKVSMCELKCNSGFDEVLIDNSRWFTVLFGNMTAKMLKLQYFIGISLPVIKFFVYAFCIQWKKRIFFLVHKSLLCLKIIYVFLAATRFKLINSQSFKPQFIFNKSSLMIENYLFIILRFISLK